MEKGDIGSTSALYVWNGFSVFWGSSFSTSPHKHDTLQLTFDIEKNFLVKDEKSEWTPYAAAIIRASHPHQLDSNGSMQLFFYLDKDSEIAKKLTAKYLSETDIGVINTSTLRILSNDFFKTLLASKSCEELFIKCHAVLTELVNVEYPKKRDERIDEAIAFITKSSDKNLRIKAIANHVCLSESRLRHLFKEQVGQPIQNFILWMKVVDSLSMVLKGNKLSDAAYSNGFWDISHMNKSYKALIGVNPADIAKQEDNIKIVSCTSMKNFFSIRTGLMTKLEDETPYKWIEINSK